MPELPDLPSFELRAGAKKEPERIGSTHFGFLGIGQAGGRIAQTFYEFGYPAVAVNTAPQDLEVLTMPADLRLHTPTSSAGGAGKDMDVGRKAFLSAAGMVKDILRRAFEDVEHIIVCVGAGGGSGGGAAAEAIKLSREFLAAKEAGASGQFHVGKRVGIISTLPDHGEAVPRVAANAIRVVKEVRDAGPSPWIIIDNQEVRRLLGSLPPARYWPTANGVISGLLHSINLMAAQPSHAALDPADFRSILGESGCAILGSARVEEVWDTAELMVAIRDALGSTLLGSGFDWSTCISCGAVVVANDELMEKQAGLSEAISYVFDQLGEMTAGAVVHRGIYADSSVTGVRIYMILGGLDLPAERMRALAARAPGLATAGEFDDLYGEQRDNARLT